MGMAITGILLLVENINLFKLFHLGDGNSPSIKKENIRRFALYVKTDDNSQRILLFPVPA